MTVVPAPTDLPIEASLPDIRAALVEGRSLVVTAEPGAGKTTVVPLHLAAEPWADDQRILVLEPRRIAARAAARRMSMLVGDAVGGIVGLRTRDQTLVSEATKVEVITEGVLTRMLQHDRRLPGVAAVVFDEFHERSLQGDLGLALALDARNTVCGGLRIVVMSATLDTARVAAHLGDAPVVASPGRTHPVAVRWLPRPKKDELDEAVVAAVRRACRDEPGDILVFLPGAAEIRRVERRLVRDAAVGEPLDVRPLFGALPLHEQDAALTPPETGGSGRRRIVLATDIAESSLTVEGVRIVIDAGLARVPRFEPGPAITRLVTVAASKASTDQRAGRAGRTQPGVAYRLWSKMEQAARSTHATPEITKVDVAGFVLEVAAWGATAADLPLLDRPARRPLEDADRLLRTLGALADDGSISPLGAELLRLPLPPRLAAMVASASAETRWTACLLAAVVDERDILTGRPADRPADVDLRLLLLDDPTLEHPLLDRRAADRVRDVAADLAARIGPAAEGSTSDVGRVRVDAAADLLARAYPDRIGLRPLGSRRGRFRLPGGRTAFVDDRDALANAEEVVVADLLLRGNEGRIVLGAGRFPAITDVDLSRLNGG